MVCVLTGLLLLLLQVMDANGNGAYSNIIAGIQW